MKDDPKPVTEAEIAEAVSAAARDPIFRGKKVVFASQDKVADLAPYLERILVAMGYPGAWISDLSAVSDFGLDDDEYAQLGRTLGVPVVRGDSMLVDIAQRMRDSET